MNMKKISNSSYPSRQNGASIIEVMISLFVLAIGMLGVLAMQVNSIQASKNASLYSQANFLAIDIIEAMRSSPSSPASFLIDFGNAAPDEPACTTAGSDCTATQMADWSVYHWRQNVTNLLPGGTSAIERNGDEYTVTVRFVISYDEETNAAVTDEIQVSTVF